MRYQSYKTSEDHIAWAQQQQAEIKQTFAPCSEAIAKDAINATDLETTRQSLKLTETKITEIDKFLDYAANKLESLNMSLPAKVAGYSNNIPILKGVVTLIGNNIDAIKKAVDKTHALQYPWLKNKVSQLLEICKGKFQAITTLEELELNKLAEWQTSFTVQFNQLVSKLEAYATGKKSTTGAFFKSTELTGCPLIAKDAYFHLQAYQTIAADALASGGIVALETLTWLANEVKRCCADLEADFKANNGDNFDACKWITEFTDDGRLFSIEEFRASQRSDASCPF